MRKAVQHPSSNATARLRCGRQAAVTILGLLSILATGCGGGGGGASAGPTFSLSTNTLTFTAQNQNAPTPASQTITGTVSGGGSGTLYIIINPTGPAVSSVTNPVITPPSSGHASVNPASPASLGIGTFASTITVTACLNDSTCATGQLAGSPQIVNVTYTIPGVIASSSSLSYTTGNTTMPSDLTRQFTVTGAPNQNWNAGSSVPWLSVAPPTGNAGAPVQLTTSLIQGQLDAMTNGTYTGSVTITPDSGLAVTVPVTLTIGRTQVNYVSPYVAFTGTSAEVIIRGENLSQITVDAVKFGSDSTANFSVVSDTEVRATHPVLAAGSYPVQLQNSQGFNRSLANLVVVDAPVYSPTTLSYPVAPNSLEPFGLAYDAERRALLISRRSDTQAPSALLRYQFSGSAWSGPTEVAVPGIMSIALSPDGSIWLAGTEPRIGHDAGITQLKATDLSIVTTTGAGLNPSVGSSIMEMAVANDGIVLASVGVLVNPLYDVIRYTLRSPAFSALTSFSVSGDVAASGDGSRIVSASGFSNEIYHYDASTRVTSLTGISFNFVRSRPSLSRTGSRFVLNDGEFNSGIIRVFDGTSFAALGDLPATTVAAVISPDGNRAYTFDSNGKLRTFNLAGTPPGTGNPYPEVGTGTTLAGSPGTPAFVPGLGIRMIISPDGGTVFLAGGDRIVIQPVP
jgi:hypothetical protein